MVRRFTKKKPLVRLHLEGVDSPSLQGILMGKSQGHYILRSAEIVQARDQKVALDGREARIPKGKVLIVQDLTEAA